MVTSDFISWWFQNNSVYIRNLCNQKDLGKILELYDKPSCLISSFLRWNTTLVANSNRLTIIYLFEKMIYMLNNYLVNKSRLRVYWAFYLAPAGWGPRLQRRTFPNCWVGLSLHPAVCMRVGADFSSSAEELNCHFSVPQTRKKQTHRRAESSVLALMIRTEDKLNRCSSAALMLNRHKQSGSRRETSTFCYINICLKQLRWNIYHRFYFVLMTQISMH